MARRKGRLSNDSFAIAPVNFPTGSVLDFAGSTAPDGWLLCYGQAVSRTDYASLFATLGETYGSGDGSTTFNLPDYRGRVLVGRDNMGGSAAGRMTSVALSIGDGNTLGANGGSQTHSISTAEVGSHTHTTVADVHQHFLFRNATASVLDSLTASDYVVDELINGTASGNYQMSANANPANVGLSATDSHSHTVNSNVASAPHQNTQPSIIANKIIKV